VKSSSITLPQMWPTAAEGPAYDATMKAIKGPAADLHQRYRKCLRKKEEIGTIPTDLAFYKNPIDENRGIFSEWTSVLIRERLAERRPVAAGSGWIQDRTTSTFMGKGQAAAEKYSGGI